MAASNSVAITYVPADCASIIFGKSRTPQAFVDVGVEKKLKDSGFTTTQQWVLDQPATWRETTFESGRVRNEDLNVEVCQKVKKAIANSLASDAESPPFQLILGGECAMAPAIVSAFWNHKPARRVGVIYIDADTDLNSPTDPGSIGNLAGMTMTHLVGHEGALESMKQFSRADGVTPVCGPDNTVLFGVNMAFPGNKRDHLAYLFDHNYKVVSSSSIAKDPVQRAEEALKYLEDKVDVIAVHLDVDSIDPGLFPLANLPNMTGVQFPVMMKALKVLLKSPKAGGLTIAEVNPDHDPGLRMTGRLVNEVVDALKGRKLAIV